MVFYCWQRVSQHAYTSFCGRWIFCLVVFFFLAFTHIFDRVTNGNPKKCKPNRIGLWKSRSHLPRFYVWQCYQLFVCAFLGSICRIWNRACRFNFNLAAKKIGLFVVHFFQCSNLYSHVFYSRRKIYY